MWKVRNAKPSLKQSDLYFKTHTQISETLNIRLGLIAFPHHRPNKTSSQLELDLCRVDGGNTSAKREISGIKPILGLINGC